MSTFSRYLLAATAAVSTLLTGCGAGVTAGPVQTEVQAMRGQVHGGQAPIVGSHVYVMQASTTAYGGPGVAALASSATPTNASSSLLTGTGNSDATGGYVTTDSNGFFAISSKYTCTVGVPVYLYVTGGNAGGGANANIGLMAALGACPAAGNFYTGGTALSYVWVNEVTTVAAAYAMSGFATDATHVGIGPVGSASAYSTQALTGIQNAFATAANLANITTGNAVTTTPGGNGTAPTSEINTLANILAYCVNTTGDATFGNCATLFGDTPGTTTPTDTATAAINIAHAPATNVSALYGLQAGVAAPFLNDLGAAPNDFSVSLILRVALWQVLPRWRCTLWQWMPRVTSGW